MAKASATSRLHLVLEHIAANAGRHPSGPLLSKLLNDYVGAPVDDAVRAQQLYGKLITLCVHAIEEVEQCFDDPHLEEPHRSEARKQAAQPLQNVLQMFTSQGVQRPAHAFVVQQMDGVRVLALATQQRVGVEMASEQKLAEIRTTIKQLEGSIRDSSLPAALKGLFLRILRQLEQALDDYRFSGEAEALAALASLMGLTTVANAEVNEKEQPVVWEHLSRLVNLLTALGVSYNVAHIAIANAPLFKALLP